MPCTNYQNDPLEPLKLKRVITGQNQTMIQSDDNSYVLQVEEDKANTKYKTYDPITKKWIGGMFPSEDFIIDDYFANQKLDPSLTSSINARGGLGQVSGIAQCGDFSVLFKTNVNEGNHWQEGSDPDNYEFEDLSVALYDMATLSGENTCYYEFLSAEGVDPTTCEWSNTSIPPKSLSGITWGFLTDAPVALEYYDFDEGRLYGNSFKCKNPWNLSYDISAKIEDSTFTDVSGNEILSQEARIEDVRSYVDMRIGAGKPWLAYKVQNSYSGSREITKTNNNNFAEDLVTPVGVSLSGSKTDGVFAYDHIERIAGIKRNIGSNSHKSNIFSVRIKDSGLNNSIDDETIRAQTQDGLDKVIREVIERIKPAHTSLWKIDWQGK